MSKTKRMGRKSLSILLAVLMVLTSMYAGLGVVAEALTYSSLPGKGGTLTNGSVYKVTSNTTITADANQNGLVVADKAVVVIDIKAGVTLTVTGGAGSDGSGKTAGKGGKAGIYLPNTSALIVTGGGTLNVTGGKGGNAGNGADGASGHVDYNNMNGGNGGAGGGGAGGGGAGIGGNGGNGGAGGAGGGGAYTSTTYDHDYWGSGGSDGSVGGNGDNGGTVYALSGSVNATGGAKGNVGSKGNGGSYDSGQWANRFTAGGGGGGGAGGAGSAGSEIGGGGYGGGGAGGGGGGGTYTRRTWKSYVTRWGAGGGGGSDSGASGGNGGYRGDNGGSSSGGSGKGHGSAGSHTNNSTTLGNQVKAWNDFYKSDAWKTTLLEMVENLTAEELIERKTTAQNAYNGIKTYKYTTNGSVTISKNIKEHLSEAGFIDTNGKYETYIANLDKAIPIKLVKESVDTLISYVDGDKGYANYSDEQKTALRNELMAKYLKPDGSYDTVAMNSDAEAVNGAITTIEGVDNYQSILADVQDMGGAYAKFNLDDCRVYNAALAEALEICKLINIKIAFDADYNTYKGDVADEFNGEDVIAQAVLEALQLRTNTNYNAIYAKKDKPYFNEVFPDGMQYVIDFKADVDLMVDVRAAEKIYNENYYQYFANDKIFEAYSLWDNGTLETRYDEDKAKNNSLKSAYAADMSRFGEAIASRIYTINFEGTNMLLQDAVDIYLGRLKQTMLDRNDAQIARIYEFAKKDDNGNMTTIINIDNFMGIKGAIGQYDATLYNYVVNKNNVEPPWPIADPHGVVSKIAELLASYNAYLENPNDIVQKHNHDANGVFTTRYAGEQTVNGQPVGYANDIARDGADDNYIVNNTNIQKVIDRLEGFLKSNELSYLATDFDEPLNEMLMRMVADNLFKDETINMLVTMLYPMLLSTIEDLVQQVRNEAGSYLTSIDSIETLSNNLGLGVYPKQVAAQLNNTFSTAKAALNNAGTNWNSSYIKSGDDYTIDWGINSITDEGISVQDYYLAKANRFKSALAQSLKALEKALLALFAEGSYSVSGKHVGKAAISYGIGTARPDLTLDLSISPLAGYSILVAPILEALGLDSKTLTQQQAKSQLTSIDRVVEKLIDPISDFVTEELGVTPVNTLLKVLPNLMFALSFDKLQGLIDRLNITINYQVHVSGIADWIIDLISIFVSALENLKGSKTICLGDSLKTNNLLKDENGVAIPLSDVNALIAYFLKSILPGVNLPVINGGRIIMSAEKKTGVSTKRVGGSRINFVADKPDEFYVILNWLVNALADEGFVENLLYALGGITPNDNIKAIVSNIARDPDATLAALVELVVPQTYSFMDYDWATSPLIYDCPVDNLGVKDVPYLHYQNNWTKDKAQAIVDSVDDTLNTILNLGAEPGAEPTTLDSLLAGALEGLFNNKTMTGFAKLLVGLGTLFADTVDETGVHTPNKLYDIIKREIHSGDDGVDLRVWFNAFGALFAEENADAWAEKNIVAPAATTALNGVTASVSGEDIVWSYNGEAFEDGNREQFVDIFCALAEEFDPAVKLIFTGDNLTLLNNLFTVQGYDTYEHSLEVLFDAIDFSGTAFEAAYKQQVNIPDANDYATTAATSGVAAFRELADGLSDWITFVTSEKTTNKLLAILPKLVYYFQSNGLAAALHNLLMPILVLVDIIRPVIDVDLNLVLSSLLSDLLNEEQEGINTEALVGVLFGTGTGADPAVDVDVNNLRLTDVLALLDTIIGGTQLAQSPLATFAIPALYSGMKENTSELKKLPQVPAVDAADTLTILLSGIIEALRYTLKDDHGQVIMNGDKPLTNEDLLLPWLDKLLRDKEDPSDQSTKASDIVLKLKTLFNAEITDLGHIHWGFMQDPVPETYTNAFTFPHDYPQTTEILNYLSYSNDWTEELARYIYNNRKDIVDSILDLVNKDAAEEDKVSLTSLLNGLFNDNLYNDDVLNGVLGMLVKLIGGLDKDLRNVLEVLLDLDGIETWFDNDHYTIEYDGDDIVGITPVEPWGITDKKSFIAAFKTAAEPLYPLIGWLFFGDDYTFGTGSEKNDEGKWTYNDLLTLKGGEGYKYGLIPVMEALGCDPAAAEDFKKADGTYNIEAAVDSFLTILTGRLDAIAGNPVDELLNTLPNVIYFLNADGLDVCVKNLIAPLDTLVGAILGEGNSVMATLGIQDLKTGDLLDLISGLTGLNFNEIEREIISTFYIGKAEYFTSKNGDAAFRIKYTENAGAKDMITIIVSLLLDMLKHGEGNAEAIDKLIDKSGEKHLVSSALAAIGGMTVDYETINWNYYVDDEGDNAEDVSNTAGIVTGDFTDVNGIKYLEKYNDWKPETAQYVDQNLQKIVNLILGLVGKEDLETLLANVNIYSEDTVKMLMGALSGALKGLENIDETLLALIGQVLNADLSSVLDYDAETAHYNVSNKEELLNVLFGEEGGEAGILTPFNRVFEFLLFGKDYAYFTSAEVMDPDTGDGIDLITLDGADGYRRGLVPILEALGVVVPEIANNKSAIAILREAADAVFTKIDGLLNVDNMDASLNEVLAMLPEVFYFLNADGLRTSVNNLLAALYGIRNALSEIDGAPEINLSALTDKIDMLTVEGIVHMIEDATGLEIPAKIVGFIQNNRLGKIVDFTDSSKSGVKAYKAEYLTDDHSELITCILSAVLETLTHKDNAQKLDAMIGKDVVANIVALLTSGTAPEYTDINWNYDEDLAASPLYVGYKNNWTEETAKYVDENLDEIADLVAQQIDKPAGGKYASLAELISDKVDIYTDDTVKLVAGKLHELIGNIDNLLRDKLAIEDEDAENEAIAFVYDLINKLVGIDLRTPLTYDDTAVYGVNDQATFVSEMVNLLDPFDRLLSLLLLGDDYKYFVYAGAAEGKTEGDDIIVLKGADGYKKGLIPLLEAVLGTENVKASYSDIDTLLTDVLTKLCTKIDAVLADPTNEALALLPNLIYFIDADGLTAVVKNVLAVVINLYDQVKPMLLEDGNTEAINNLFAKFNDLSMRTLLTAAEDATGLKLVEPIGDYLSAFKFGEKSSFTSKNGDTAYRKDYNEADARYDMLTIVASLLLEVVDTRSNETKLKSLLGSDAYQAIYNLLNMTEVEAEMLKINWKHTDKADTGEVIEPLDTSAAFNPYGPLFTREKAQFMADHFQEFIDNLIQLLGIEGKDGKFINSLEDLLQDVVGNSLYTTENLNKIYSYIDGAVKKVDSITGAKHIKQVLKKSNIADLSAYDGYTVNAIAEGDRNAFKAEIIRMVQPLYGALKWLLTDTDLMFFTDKHDEDQVVLLGAEGYKYGIVPVLEALLCTGVNGGSASFASTILTQEEYEAAVESDPDALLNTILDPVFDKLDQVLADPANELFNLIPNLQYFINSNALDTCFQNILNAVTTLLNAIEPLTGKMDVLEIIGLKDTLNDLTMSSIVNALVSNIGTDDIKLDGMNFDKLLKCFNGYLYSYTNSKSGENPAYWMGYAGEAAKADTLAVILQMLLEWIASGDNPAKLKQIIREKVDMSDEGYAYADKLIDIVAAYCKTPSGTDSILHMLYYIFYAAYTGTTKVANWQKDYNTRLELVAEGQVNASKRDENLGKVAELLDWLFATYGDGDENNTGNVYHNYDNPDDDMPSPAVGKPKGFAPNGFIAFFRQIIEWFRSIFNKIFKH